MSEYIKIADCVHGGHYLLYSRNLATGVFNSATNGFVGIREKFGREYLDTEYHRGEEPIRRRGLAAPVKLLGMCPVAVVAESVLLKSANGLDCLPIPNRELFDWLKSQEIK